jgi:hypothetical protein
MTNELPSANPYEPPQASRSPMRSAAVYPRASASIYRWVGVLGLFFYAVLGAVLLYIAERDFGRWRWNDAAVWTLHFTFGIVFFTTCRVVAGRLVTSPARVRRPARWLGFIMAVWFFPILTIPGLFAVWKLDQFFEREPATDRSAR